MVPHIAAGITGTIATKAAKKLAEKGMDKTSEASIVEKLVRTALSFNNTDCYKHSCNSLSIAFHYLKW